jgi:hypothetical protein
LVKQGVAFTDSVITKEWADVAAANDVDIKNGARYVNYLYGKTTDADIMKAYENIAANHENENVRNLAK